MTSEYHCPHCPNPDPIPPSSDSCPACDRKLPVPNLRAADRKEEKEALKKRVEEAEEEAEARGCKDILDDFGDAVSSSSAVICRSLGFIHEMVSNNALYNTFYKQVAAKARLPEDNEFDHRRETIDTMVFPLYHREIVFAALTLDGRGATAFGGHSMVLKEQMISYRATVFETNTFNFVTKHKINAGDPIPAGYRATWDNRDQVAKAKLQAKIDGETTSADYSGILLEQGESTDIVEYVEVHIYGGFNRAAIEKVVLSPATSDIDEHIIKSLKRKLETAGILVEDP